MTKYKEGTRVTCDIFIVFDYVYVYKKHAKNSIFIWFGTYLHSKSCIQCFLRAMLFFCLFSSIFVIGTFRSMQQNTDVYK